MEILDDGDVPVTDAPLTLEHLSPVSETVLLYTATWGFPDGVDGEAEAMSLVVMKKADGFLLAVPDGFLPEEVLSAGRSEPDQGQIGSSKKFTINGVMYQDGHLVPIGSSMQVVVVDLHEDLASILRPYDDAEEVQVAFAPDDPEAFPDPSELLQSTMEWLREEGVGNRALAYTPEVTAESGEKTPPTQPKTRGRGPKAQKAQPGGAMPSANPPKPKKITTASLAESLQAMSSTMEAILTRQQQLESQVLLKPQTTTTLAQPLSSQVVAPAATMANVLKTMQPPPRTTTAKTTLAGVGPSAPTEVIELEEEKKPGDTLAQAMLAQSAALTTLVAQIAGASQDPMGDLSQTSTTSTRGAQGRARLQNELAAHKGSFHESVMAAMARRMQPTSPSNISHTQMMQNGISGTKYLERFGGYGKARDIGVIQYQLMIIMDYMQVDNHLAAKDSLALLCVMLEQAALDGGRLDLGQILTLSDDPPSSIFSNRQMMMVGRTKAFAPLADQRWVTVALAYLKELDTITTKRVELLSASSTAASSLGGGGGVPAPKVKQAPKAKQRGRGKQQKAEEEE